MARSGRNTVGHIDIFDMLFPFLAFVKL